MAPLPISAQDPVGHIATMVGFGTYGTGQAILDEENTRKRAAQNTVDGILGFGFGPNDNGALVFDFDHPEGTTNSVTREYGTPSDPLPLPLEGSTSFGDSGGPLLVDFGEGFSIVAVASSGFNPFSRTEDDERVSLYGDIAEWAPVRHAENVAFLQSHGLTVLGAGDAETQPDADGDGVPDAEDFCPTFPGRPETNGR